MINDQQFKELDEILKKMQFGDLDFKASIHAGKIRNIEVYGKKKIRNKTHIELIEEMLKRIKTASEAGQSVRLKFEVNVYQGKVTEVEWDSNFTRSYK